jgi:DNA primase
MSLDDLKQKIKEEIPISNIIGNYLAIKRSGSSMVAICPFHGDTKPSMHVNDSKKIYKCFACGAAGDAITFVMKSQNLDYIDALKDICSKQGLHFESYQEERKSNPKIEMGKKILSKTAQLYRKMATTHKHAAYDDFIKNRGLDEEIAAAYSLGFATSKNSLYEYLSSIPNETERAFAISIAQELTLIRTNPNNPENHYDTFRERIIFPIWDQFGQVIGFTSRAIRDDQQPKYMNSKDSFLFNKGNLLYGLHLAKNAIREKDFVILVEGNMDQIALTHFGFKNSVAVMGVALGPQSLERLLTLTKNIYVAMDSDKAGFIAMKRINTQLAEKGIVPKYLEFTPEKDPDEFLKAQGAIKLQEKIDNAVSCFDVLLEKAIPEKLPEIVDKKLAILNEAFEILSPLHLQLAATERVVNFAKRIGLKADSNQIVTNYSEFISKKSTNNFIPKASSVPKQQESTPNIEEYEKNLVENELFFSSEEEIIPFIALTKMEKQVVQELVQLPSLITQSNVNEILDLVNADEVKKYIGKVGTLFLEVDENEYSSIVLNLVDGPEYSPDLKEAVANAIFKYKPKELDSKSKTRLIHDLKTKLQTEKLLLRKEELKQKQLSLDTQEELNQLFSEITKIEKELQAIKKLKPEKK